MKKETPDLILYAIAFACGVAIFVLSYLGIPTDTTPFIGIAIFCLGMAGIRSIKSKNR
jgi:hypothetical protein